ncbi:MAG: hypothetical protein EOO45_02570 [Flavobacterium sp.]|nr:MAG: hypothetical protein EOO45_02570 [Flavobacterium sp.]
MKNIFYKLGVAVLFVTTLVSCDEDRVVLNTDKELYQFASRTSDLPISEVSNSGIVQLGATNRSNVDRTIPITVDATSTATGAQYTIPTSVTIPAGEFVGDIEITGNFDELPEGEDYTIVITIDDTAYPVIDGKNFHVVTLFKYCGTESLAGLHSYVSTDFIKGGTGPVPGTASGTMAWTEPSTGMFTFPDLSYGHYGVVWNDSAAANGTVGVQWTCNGLRAFGTDQYNDPFTYNIISVEGPVMVFTWSNTYGDGGTVTLTRAGGEDWPDGLLAN